MLGKSLVNEFSPHLFWDVRRASIDIEKHSEYLIKQVLEYGLLQDWNLLKKIYGIDRIVQTAKTLRELDAKTMSLMAVISNTPYEEFKCYTSQQSKPQHWNF